MALQICAVDGTRYAGVNEENGTAAVCPVCGSDQYHSEGVEPEGWTDPLAPAAPEAEAPAAAPEAPPEPEPPVVAEVP